MSYLLRWFSLTRKGDRTRTAATRSWIVIDTNQPGEFGKFLRPSIQCHLSLQTDAVVTYIRRSVRFLFAESDKGGTRPQTCLWRTILAQDQSLTSKFGWQPTLKPTCIETRSYMDGGAASRRVLVGTKWTSGLEHVGEANFEVLLELRPGLLYSIGTDFFWNQP